MSDVIIYGGTGQAIVDRPILEDSGHRIVAVFDDTPGIMSPFTDIPIYPGSSVEILCRGKDLRFVVAIGNPHGRRRLEIADQLHYDFGFYSIYCISDKAVVRVWTTHAHGAQIMDGAIIQPKTTIGYQVIINTGAIIDHECVIGDGCEVGPGATLCGLVTMEKYSWVGAGAVVLPRLTIGEGAIVGAGAVVTKDVDPYTVVVGNPARFVRVTDDYAVVKD
jgi:sugar O-acyltransferase (sialic acid O-acetyltransferase NeuD family)